MLCIGSCGDIGKNFTKSYGQDWSRPASDTLTAVIRYSPFGSYDSLYIKGRTIAYVTAIPHSIDMHFYLYNKTFTKVIVANKTKTKQLIFRVRDSSWSKLLRL